METAPQWQQVGETPDDFDWRSVMKAWFSLAAIVCAMAVGPAAFAGVQDKPATTKPGTTGTPGTPQDTNAAKPTMSADATFIKTAAMDGMAEVEHGGLAAKNAASNEVKQFAQRMVDDHGKANTELKSLASQKNVTLPPELDAKHKAMQDKLSKLNGAAFDSAYMAHMAAAHKEAVTLFQREAKTGKDAETRAFAEKTLPTLREHLKMAQDLGAKNKTDPSR
jgi:putative membrane protein